MSREQESAKLSSPPAQARAARRPPVGLIWERAPSPLKREQIVRAAIAVADAEGSQGVSMRRIAGELGAGAMSLYRHVSGKEDLLDLMLDEVFAEIALPATPNGDWRASLRALAHTTRAVFRRHPWVLPLLTSRPTLGPNYLRWFEFSLAAVATLGLNIQTTTQVVGVVNAYVIGVVGYELAEEENTRRTGFSEADKHRYATPYVQQVIASGKYPHFERFFAEGATPDPDQGFAFGLDSLLDGLHARLVQS